MKNKQADQFNNQVNDTYNRFQEAFMQRFLDPDTDPESDSFKDYSKSLSHKWKTYCHMKHLTRPAFVALEEFMTTVINDYKGRKEGTINDPVEEVESAEPKSVEHAL